MAEAESRTLPGTETRLRWAERSRLTHDTDEIETPVHGMPGCGIVVGDGRRSGGGADAAGTAAGRRTRSRQSPAHHDDDRMGRRRRDPEQVHAGCRNGRGIAGAEVV